MIRYTEKQHPVHSRCLFLDNGRIEIGVPLDFGLRVCHFSFFGEPNVFFEQPKDATVFTTEDGWRIRGGHRLWIAPEGPQTYAPDNAPIAYTLCPDGIEITQPEDPLLHIVKRFTITLEDDRVHIIHRITNTGTNPLRCSLWAISVMRAGGVEHIPLKVREGGYDPLHRFSLWDHSCLGDPRAEYRKDEILLTQQPLDAPYKIGIAHPAGPVRYENGSTVFEKRYTVQEGVPYPDGDVSFETYLSRYMVEVESLSPLVTVAPGESADHEECWELFRRNGENDER